MKTGMPLLVRMPEWVDTNQVTCTVNGALLWTGRYSSPGTVLVGQIATFLFPIGERIVRQRIGAIDATLIFRGNTVVEITPKGKNCPLYQGREKYRGGNVRWKTVERFVPEKVIHW